MDKVALKNLAEHPDVIHNPVAVISIAGAMREGKSFLLNLLIMYLESNLDSHWLDKPDTPIPFNFNWKGGIHPETRGVWIWSKPYLVQKKNGTKIALLLMDTQGCFDKSGARNDSNLFTFGTMLSSVQIYNLKEQIKENHLQSLAVFINYAKESMKKAQSMRCFQTLLFLIRDWTGEDDFPFGKEGGDMYLEQEVFHYKGNDSDIIMVRDQIKKAFTSTNCVLLPYPGMVIAKGKPKKPGTSICVKDMDDEFRDEIHHFLRILIDHLTIPLKVGQKDIVGEELLNFTSKLFDLLQTNDIENPASAMEGISMAKGQTLMQRILREYETTLETVMKSKCEASVLTRKHEEARKKALEHYDRDSAALHNNHKEPYKERLEKEIKYIFQKQLRTWQANQTILQLQYNEKLLEIIGNYERLLNEKDPSAKERVNEDFRKIFSDKPDYPQYEKKLKSRMKIIENKMEKAKEVHKGKLKNIAQTALERYQESMEKEIFPHGNKAKVFPENKMNKFHRKYKDEAMAHFAKESEGFGEKTILKREEKICKQSIDDKFEEYCAQQEDNQKRLKMFEVEASKAYRKFMDEVVEKSYVTPQTLEEVHHRFLNTAIEEHCQLSEEKHAVLYEYLKHSVEDEFEIVSNIVKERKGYHRKLSRDEAMDTADKSLFGKIIHYAGRALSWGWSFIKKFIPLL
ncbi:unnamed protein product [Clavelina lepadiformis]|uniref:GB1/RHD3-type G domain-containing protein n=1 Tax=Clavelina lepadiformis TaxID=159417 RepID=A0ABP0GI57_CLALP